jgi:hypothetical protein
MRVTITGADDSVSVPHLADLSDEFPFVEWGILVSKSQEGGSRFPSRHWIDRFSAVAPKNKMQVSMHVCGEWVRQMLTGELDWRELPSCLKAAQRIQINTHAHRHVSTIDMVKVFLRQSGKEFIFQSDGVNDHLAFGAQAYNLGVSVLFDTSHGAGKVPDNWPMPVDGFCCGYAGGLGPDNVVEQIAKIEEICTQPYWIDMESRVRTRRDTEETLDLDNVRGVLAQCKPFIERPPC